MIFVTGRFDNIELAKSSTAYLRYTTTVQEPFEMPDFPKVFYLFLFVTTNKLKLILTGFYLNFRNVLSSLLIFVPEAQIQRASFIVANTQVPEIVLDISSHCACFFCPHVQFKWEFLVHLNWAIFGPFKLASKFSG